MSNNSKLVFDIETVGKDVAQVNEATRSYFAEKFGSDEDKGDVSHLFGLYPVVGEVVSVGVLNPDTRQGGVFLRDGNKEPLPKLLEEGITLKVGNEKAILEFFWDAAQNYDSFITFNGRRFDVPFLMIRSAVCGVVPSKNLMSNRYIGTQKYGARHIDLMDQLSFYGATQVFNLDTWTKAFGIESPKSGGVDGGDVAEMYRKGDMLEIAKYNMRDVRSTAELYQKWQDYINV